MPRQQQPPPPPQRGLWQIVSAVVALFVLLFLIVVDSLDDVLFGTTVDFPIAGWALLGAVLYFIFGFRLPSFIEIIRRLVSEGSSNMYPDDKDPR